MFGSRPAVDADVLGVIACGGALGALARVGAGTALPHQPGTFPLATFLVNVVGCLLIGAVVVLLTERGKVHRLLRPFLTTGVLGGFTTFSTYAVDADQLLLTGRAGTALLYVVGTLVLAVTAAWAGTMLARAAVRREGR